MTPGIIVLAATLGASALITSALVGAVLWAVRRRGAPTPIPGFAIRVYGPLPASPKVYGRLLEEFVGEWDKRFGGGDEVRRAIDRLSIHHIRDLKQRGETVWGATLSPSTVYVNTNAPRPLRVVQHELLHVATWVTAGRDATDHGAWTPEQRRFLGELTKWGE